MWRRKRKIQKKNGPMRKMSSIHHWKILIPTSTSPTAYSTCKHQILRDSRSASRFCWWCWQQAHTADKNACKLAHVRGKQSICKSRCFPSFATRLVAAGFTCSAFTLCCLGQMLNAKLGATNRWQWWSCPSWSKHSSPAAFVHLSTNSRACMTRHAFTTLLSYWSRHCKLQWLIALQCCNSLARHRDCPRDSPPHACESEAHDQRLGSNTCNHAHPESISFSLLH